VSTGADLARQLNGDPPGTMLTVANWIFFILRKMVGAVIVSAMIRARERRGEIDPAAA
jgi:cytochrome c-type biogenesis protein CcmH/NrfF